MVRWLRPQGHGNSESARKRRVASLGYNLSSVNPSFQSYSNMVAPRRVQASESIEECMEKARLEYERMQREVQEHQERQRRLEEEEAQRKVEAEKRRKVKEEKARKKAREAQEAKEATAGPSTAWTGESHA